MDNPAPSEATERICFSSAGDIRAFERWRPKKLTVDGNLPRSPVYQYAYNQLVRLLLKGIETGIMDGILFSFSSEYGVKSAEKWPVRAKWTFYLHSGDILEHEFWPKRFFPLTRTRLIAG
jgi:hypothetical protein